MGIETIRCEGLSQESLPGTINRLTASSASATVAEGSCLHVICCLLEKWSLLRSDKKVAAVRITTQMINPARILRARDICMN